MNIKLNSQIRTTPVFHLLAGAFILATFFIMLFRLPVFGYKVQAAEFVFLLLLPAAGLRYGRTLLPTRLTTLEWLLGAYLLINLISALVSGSTAALLESLGRGYLVIVFYIFYTFAARESEEAARIVPLAFLAGALLSAVAGIAGWIAAGAGFPNFAVRAYVDYPYLGTVYRAAGFTPGMTMLLSLLLFPLLYLSKRLLSQNETRDRTGRFALLLLMGCALLTFSKTLLLLGLGLFLVWSLATERFSPRALVFITAISALTFWTGTHFLFSGDAQNAAALQGTNYAGGEIIAGADETAILPSSYSALKLAAWHIGIRHPVFGTGPGEFNAHLPELKAGGLFPQHLPDYDPHSTWMGAFAETGLPGLIVTALLWIFLIRPFYTQRHRVRQHAVLLPLAIFLLLILIESVALDIMNFRHLWVLLGLGTGLLSAAGPNSD